MQIRPNPPFHPNTAPIFKPKVDPEQENQAVLRYEEWASRIKKRALENLKRDEELLRIIWTHRFKRPKYDRFELYTPEEIMLETWEQYYYEHPDAIEHAGIHKVVNKETGYSFYTTGDPLIDQLEAAFGRGEVPDLAEAFKDIGNGPDIFRERVFQDIKGNKVAARVGMQGVKTNEKGEKITESGQQVYGTDFSADDWVKDALNDDPVLRDLARKMSDASKL